MWGRGEHFMESCNLSTCISSKLRKEMMSMLYVKKISHFIAREYRYTCYTHGGIKRRIAGKEREFYRKSAKA